MKYIRTKDSVYQITDPNRKTNITVCTNHGWVFKEDIIKQADTIEELCDEFVCVSKNGKHTVLPSSTIIDLLRAVIYGAIWTKGEHGEPILKSVAKMNEKGELELL